MVTDVDDVKEASHAFTAAESEFRRIQKCVKVETNHRLMKNISVLNCRFCLLLIASLFRPIGLFETLRRRFYGILV